MIFENGALYLTRFRGIPVWLHWSWFVVAVLSVMYRADRYTSFLWNVLEYLALFTMVVLHEFGHALACQSVGGVANKILLWPLGGVAYVQPPDRPGAHLWSIAAGPLVNLALAPLIGGAMLFVEFQGGVDVWPQFHGFLFAVFVMNASIFVFNMLPIFPLDGGQILRALLWFVAGRLRSLQIAAGIGLVGTAGLALLGLWWADWWLVLIAVISGVACVGTLRASTRQIRAINSPRRDGFACPHCGVAPPAGAFWLCGACRAETDVFATDAVCPRCAQPFATLPCMDCNVTSPTAAWGIVPDMPAGDGADDGDGDGDATPTQTT